MPLFSNAPPHLAHPLPTEVGQFISHHPANASTRSATPGYPSVQRAPVYASSPPPPLDHRRSPDHRRSLAPAPLDDTLRRAPPAPRTPRAPFLPPFRTHSARLHPSLPSYLCRSQPPLLSAGVSLPRAPPALTRESLDNPATAPTSLSWCISPCCGPQDLFPSQKLHCPEDFATQKGPCTPLDLETLCFQQ